MLNTLIFAIDDIVLDFLLDVLALIIRLIEKRLILSASTID